MYAACLSQVSIAPDGGARANNVSDYLQCFWHGCGVSFEVEVFAVWGVAE
jgi:2-keto-3-deoxy-6-phosphogluconate aldolase